MTAEQITHLRKQLGLSQAQFAERVNDMDPILRVDANAVSRYERNVRSPDPHVADALVRVWLHHGYPVTVTMLDGTARTGTLTTDSSASSYGHPVVIVGEVSHGSGDVAMIDLGVAPDEIVARAIDTGYVV